MLTEKDYCDYETCVALKELGYDEKCHAFYEPPTNKFNTTSIKIGYRNSQVGYMKAVVCPTLYEAQKWFRKEFRILIVPRYRESMEMWDCIIYDENKINIYATFTFKQYEESLLEGIKEAVKILKEYEADKVL